MPLSPGTRFGPYAIVAPMKAEDETRGNAYSHVTLVFNYFDEVRRILAGR